MDTETLKEKLVSGNMTEEDAAELLKNLAKTKESRGFTGMLQQLLDAYFAPKMWKLALEAMLIVAAITVIFVLSYTGRIDATVTSVLIGFSLGFLFGRIR